jgi:signal transduction histidine kinase
MAQIRRLLTPPVFEDETKTHQAFVLHVLLWALVVVPVPYVLLSLVSPQERTGRALLEGGVGEAVNAFLIWLLRAGHVRLAGILQVVSFWTFFTTLAATGSGVLGPAYLLGYGLTIVVAGALLGGRGAFVTTVASIAAGALMATHAQAARPATRDPLFYWGASALLFPVSALLQNLADRTVRRALGRARASEARYRSLLGDREALIRELEAKNAELERFAYTVSHDLKSPLITIRGFLDYVERDAREGNFERLWADLERIAEAANRMQALLRDLLELSRVGRLVNPPEDVPLEEVVREAVELVQGQLDARGVEVRIAPGLPVVRADRARLLEVVQNLVDNAAKFSGDAPRPAIEIGTRADGDQRVFFVRDNGMGIAPEHHQRVFRLFEKLDPGRGGTGVGLALSKRIVEHHGGRIWVESDGPGAGSTFCFTLPGAGPPSSPA